jgi:murein L,D-transpeptidase YafK
MIRATLLPALALTAAFTAGLTPVACLGEDSNRLPTKATKELPPELLSLLRQKKMPKYSPFIVRLFKEEAELEVWKQDTTGRFQILKIYPVCRGSGDLGPNLQEGDRQAPEGFNTITPDPRPMSKLVAHYSVLHEPAVGASLCDAGSGVAKFHR